MEAHERFERIVGPDDNRAPQCPRHCVKRVQLMLDAEIRFEISCFKALLEIREITAGIRAVDDSVIV